MNDLMNVAANLNEIDMDKGNFTKPLGVVNLYSLPAFKENPDGLINYIHEAGHRIMAEILNKEAEERLARFNAASAPLAPAMLRMEYFGDAGMDMIMSSLAGTAAEELCFGVVMMGCAQDTEFAIAKIIERMNAGMYGLHFVYGCSSGSIEDERDKKVQEELFSAYWATVFRLKPYTEDIKKAAIILAWNDSIAAGHIKSIVDTPRDTNAGRNLLAEQSTTQAAE